MKHVVIILLLIFGCGRASAQSLTVVRGEVIDRDGRTPDYFNVLVEQADSTAVSGSCFYTDKFEMRIPRATEPVLLCVTSLGYQDYYIKLQPDVDVVNTGRITLDPEFVSEVVIRPQTIRNLGSKAVVQVEGSTLAHLGSVTDILQRAPMVTATDDGVSVFGKGTPLIYIDGKISSYDAVKVLQPSQIVSMTIDRNPSARYDAQYRSVLKITTTRNREGISGQLYNYSFFTRRYSNWAGGHLQVNKGRWSNYLGASYQYSRSLSYSTDADLVRTEDYNLADTTSYTNRYGHHRYRIEYGSEFKISDKQTLSWQYDFSYKKNNDFNLTSSQENIFRNGVQTRLNSDRDNTFYSPTHKVNLMYTYDIAEDKKFEVMVDYGHLLDRQSQSITRTDLSDGQKKEIKVDSKSLSDVFAVQAEYSFPLLTTDFTLGTRYNFVVGNDVSLYDELHTDTRFRNDVVALYATLDKTYDKWGYSLGVRGEFSKDCVRANDDLIRNSWDNHLFPSASVHTDGLLEGVDLMFSYRSSITHPTVSQLNPAYEYINSILTKRGNVLLDSYINHSVELSATCWKILTLTASYDYDSNSIIDSGILSDDNETIFFQPVNIPRSHEYSLMASFSKEWKWFSLMLDGGVVFPHAKIPYLDSYWMSTKASYQGGVNFDVKFSPTTTFSGGFAGESRSYSLMTEWSPRYNLGFSLSQQFFRKRLTAVVSVTDLLHRNAPDWSDHYGYYEASSKGNFDTRSVRILLRYNFNRDKDKFRTRTGGDIYDRVN